MRGSSKPEPAPQPGGAFVVQRFGIWIEMCRPAAWLSAWDLACERDAYGQQKYGTALQTHNGRDAVEDARQEMGDLMLYVMQARMERRDVAPLRRLLPTLQALLEDGDG